MHQLQRAWELEHCVLASQCVTQHTLSARRLVGQIMIIGVITRNTMIKLWHCLPYLNTMRKTTFGKGIECPDITWLIDKLKNVRLGIISPSHILCY